MPTYSPESKIFVDFASTIDGVLWEADATTFQFNFISSKVFDILGYTVEEWMSDPDFWKNRIHPEDRDNAINYCHNETVLGKNHTFDYRFLHKLGHYVWIQDRASVVMENGKPKVLRGILLDISSHKQLLKDLENERSVKNQLILESPNALFLINQDARFVFWNNKMTEITGFSDDDMKNMNAFDFYSDDNKKVIQNKITNVYETGGVEFEIDIISKHNRVIPIFIKASQFIYNNEPHILGIAIEIIDRRANEEQQKIIEKQLRLSEKRYKALVQEGSDMTSILSAEGIYNYISPNYITFTGHTEEELIGQNAFNFVHPDDLLMLQKEFSQLTTEKRVNSSPYRFKRKDGTYCWIRSVGTNLLDEEVINGIVINSIDVTSLIETQKALNKSNERFERVTEATNDAIWDWDFETNSLYWSSGYNSLFGYSSTNPKFETWSKNIHPEDRDRVMSKLDFVLESKSISKIFNEYRFRKRNGEYTYIQDKGVIIRNEAGEIVRMVGLISDISHRKEYEESLKQLNTELKNKIDELDKSNKELEQFAYIASHDLQEPLRMVTGFLTQLKKKYENQLDEKAQAYIQFAVDGASRMNTIILDLLEYSRAGLIVKNELVTVDLNEVLADVKILLNKKIVETEALIQSNKLPTVKTSYTGIRQVLQNIIVNALKYQKENERPIIQIEYENSETHHVIHFRDNGIGIDEKYHVKIFELFQRLHTREQYQGTGIGLALTKKIIEQLGGDISVVSKLNEGSLFTIRIPHNYENI